jgi:hypothetical protein
VPQASERFIEISFHDVAQGYIIGIINCPLVCSTGKKKKKNCISLFSPNGAKLCLLKTTMVQ